VKLEMIKIPAGSFLMGSNNNNWQQPIHQVTLQEFYLGKYPVTQEQWQAVMGNNPSRFNNNSKNPVDSVSWNDCQKFCQKLSQVTGKRYRLPSEAEWEYACRAGSLTRYSFGDDAMQLQLIDYAWYWDNSYLGTHPVGQKKPNPWKLYDMYGNVWEWCEDNWHPNYKGAPTDGSTWNDSASQNNRRVLRGGSLLTLHNHCRSSYRLNTDVNYCYYDRGFRLALG
jgi:formylglycine-generating enzyme required for sulfatase activity